ncbi:MAG: PAS domain-containing protein, partial [Akkermansia sp.]|nr:PAS domain-containing protein [Akkermansia sp.]
MSNTPEQNNAKRTVPGVFVWDMVRKALRAAEEGVFCWMFENDEIFYTEQCVKMMGMTMKDWAPNIFTEPEKTIHPEDVSFFTTAVKRYIGRPAYSTTPLRVEVRLLNQSNRGWRWVRINGLLEYGPDKKPTRLVGVWVDITRRKMADLHAMEDRDLFRTLINYLPDNIYFKNRESRFVIANEATAKKMKVRTPADLI